MLIFNKLLPMFVLPIGVVVFLLLFGLIRKRRWPVIAALALLYLCSTPMVGDWLCRSLESRYPPTPLDAVETADAIVALGGIFGPRTSAGFLPNIAEAGERLEAGIQLWQRKRAPVLVFTGGRMPWDDHVEVEGALSAKEAERRGVPAESIVVTAEVGNTADEARVVAALMRERGWKKIVLVTSAAHMPRAARQFRKASVDFVPFVVDYQIASKGSVGLFDLLPQAESLRRTEAALREWYGIAFYAIVS